MFAFASDPGPCMSTAPTAQGFLDAIGSRHDAAANDKSIDPVPLH
jgi:hypothetical protein